MARINWFPPEKKPCATDAVVVTRKGVKIWRSWDGAAPGQWECWCRDYGTKMRNEL